MIDMMVFGGIEYLRCLMGVSLLAGLILVIRKYCGKRLPGRLIYGMWLMIPIYMVLVHFVRIPMPHFMNEMIPVGLVEEFEIETYANTQQVTNVQLPDDNEEQILHTGNVTVENRSKIVTAQDNISETIVKRINPFAVAGCIYVVVVFLFVGTILFVNVLFAMQCKRKRVYFGDSSERRLAVYRLTGISSPFLMGANIYVPADMENEEELRYAILHEECHYKHGDAFWVVLRYLILGIFFYNPIMWLAFKYSGYDCELACDEAVMRNLQEKEIKNYGGCLLNAIEKNKEMQARVLLSTNLKSNKKLIRERIENIVTKRKKSYVAMLLSFLMLFTVTGFFLIDTKSVNAEEIIPSDEKPSQVAEVLPYKTDSEKTQEFIIPADEESIIKDDYGPTFDIPSDWDYQLNPYKITDFLNEEGEEAKDGYLFGFAERIKNGGSEWWKGVEEFYTNVYASSTLAPQGMFAYAPCNLSVPSRYCIWSEGADEYGIGEWVEVEQLYTGEGEEWLHIDEICIVNGYAENETKWTKNSRAKSLKFYFENVYMGTIHLEDTMYPQYIDVSELQMYVPNGTEAVFRFEIAEVYEGSEFADTCITGIEIGFQGKGGN